MSDLIKNKVRMALNEASDLNRVYKELQTKFRSTYPKIPTEAIFKNPVNTAVLTMPIGKKAYDLMDNDRYESLPVEMVAVDMIVPTQKVVTASNLASTSDVGEDTGAYLLKFNNYYYVLDGHHRISNEILRGADNIKAHVFE